MTMNAKRRRVHDKLAGLPGVRPVRRPVSPGSAEEFDLYYVRTGRKSAHPLVIIPGGPGVASVQLYKGLRRRAAAAGLDVIMVEHRGVGMSRHDDAGADLPPEALTVDQVVDDVAAVLDDAHVDKAVIYGTSYGTYIAAGRRRPAPGRVHAMILDSPLLSRHDIDAVRGAIRGLLLDGDSPETAALVPKVRQLVDAGVMTASGGQIAATNLRLRRARAARSSTRPAARRSNDAVAGALRVHAPCSTRKVPYRNETDLVGRIAFRELDYAAEPDGLPLDPAVAMREIYHGDSRLSRPSRTTWSAEMPKFDWPTVVISGGRDLVTPPAVAERDRVAVAARGAGRPADRGARRARHSRARRPGHRRRGIARRIRGLAAQAPRWTRCRHARRCGCCRRRSRWPPPPSAPLPAAAHGAAAAAPISFMKPMAV